MVEFVAELLYIKFVSCETVFILSKILCMEETAQK